MTVTTTLTVTDRDELGRESRAPPESRVDTIREQPFRLVGGEAGEDPGAGAEPARRSGEQDANVLNGEERQVFYEYTTWRFATWELTYLEYEDGLIDEETWLAWDGYYMLMTEGNPGYRKFFSDTRQQWDTRFMAHVVKSLGLTN